MPWDAVLSNGKRYTFPDDVDEKQAQRILVSENRGLFPDAQGGLLDAGMSSGKRLLSNINAAGDLTLGAILDDEERFQRGIRSLERGEEWAAGSLPAPVTLDEISKTYEDEGLGSAVGRTGQWALETMGQSLPYMVPMLGAGKLAAGPGARALSQTMPQVTKRLGQNLTSTLAGHTAGATSMIPAFYADNLARQVEEGAITEDQLEPMLAALAAPAQSALEYIFVALMGNIGRAPQKAAALSISQFLKRQALEASTEIPTEMAQTVLERAQAGASISPTDREAVEEVLYAGLAGGVAGAGFGTVSTATQIPGVLRQRKLLEQEEALRKEQDEAIEKNVQEEQEAIIAGGGDLVRARQLGLESLDPVNAQIERQTIAELIGRPVTPEDIHNAARSRNILYDDDIGFLAFSKKVTSGPEGEPDVSMIDDMDDDQRRALYNAVTSFTRQPIEPGTAGISLPTWTETEYQTAINYHRARKKRKARKGKPAVRARGQIAIDNDGSTIREALNLSLSDEDVQLALDIRDEAIRRGAAKKKKGQIVLSKKPWYSEAEYREVLNRSRSRVDAKTGKPAPMVTREIVEEVTNRKSLIAINGLKKDMVDRGDAARVSTQTVPITMNSVLRNRDLFLDEDKGFLIRTSPEEGGEILGGRTNIRAAREERKRLEERDTRYFLVAEDGLIVGNQDGYKPSRQKHGKKKDPKATANSARQRLRKKGIDVAHIVPERPTYYVSESAEPGFRIGERRADLYGHTAPFEVEFLGDEDTAKKRMRTLTGEFAGGFPVEQRIADTVEGEVDARLPQRIDTRTQEYSKEEIARREALLSSLTRSLAGFGLNDIRLRLTEVFRGEGGVDEVTGEAKPILRPNTEGEYAPARIITLALNNLTSDMSPEQQAAALVDVMNHEIIHALRALDLFTNSEWVVLRKYVETRPYPGDPNGRTYYEVAMDTYADDLASGEMGIDDIFEEAVAQAFRFYVKDPKGVVGTPRSLFERIMSFLEKIGNFLVSNDLTTSEDIFEEIRTGRIGGRARGEVRTIKDVLTPKGQAWAKIHHVIGPGDKPKESRVVDPQYRKLGGSFRSALGTSLREVPEGQEKKNLEQWRKYLQNTGVTLEEMQWSGLDDYMESLPEDRKSIHVNDIKNNVLELGINEYKVARPKYEDVLRFQGDDYTELVITLPQSHDMDSFRQWYDASVTEFDDTPGAENISMPDELIWQNLSEEQRREAIRRYRLETGDVLEISDIMSDVPRRRTFRTSHFGEDVLVHIRYTIDTDADGNRILLIQEIQSDWHQRGRAEGYRGDPLKREVDPETIQLKKSEWVAPMTELERRAMWMEDFLNAPEAGILEESVLPWTEERASAATETYEAMEARGSALWFATNPDGRPIPIASIFGTGFIQAPSYEEAMDYAKNQALAINEEERNVQVPHAPFKNTWHALGLKRAIAIAASKGIDRIAWTTGKQQIELQEGLIAENVDRLEWESTKEGIISVTAIPPSGESYSMDFYGRNNTSDDLMSVHPHPVTNEFEHLRDVFGPIATERVADNPESGSMPGSEMIKETPFFNTLYDKKLVQVANAIGRKYGSEVESIELGRVGQSLHSFAIPDELKRNILAQGFNLFGKKESRRIHADRQLGIFRSRLKDALDKAEEKNLPPMTPAKIIDYLGKNGVTQDEIIWSGLEEYLKDPPGTLMVNSGKHKGKIVLSLLWSELNPVQIEEQFFTGQKVDDDDLILMRDRYIENEHDRYGVVEVEEGDVNQDEDSDEYGEDRHGRTVGFYAEEDAGDALMGPYDSESEAQDAISERVDSDMDYVDDDDVVNMYGTEGATLYDGTVNASSTMTGEWEDSYEELLLRLPRSFDGSRRPLGPAIPQMLGHYAQDHDIDDGLVWGRYTQKRLDNTELPSFVRTYEEAVSKLKEMGYTFVLGGVTGERGSWGITSPDELIDLVNSGTARSMADRNLGRVFFIEEIQSDIESRVSQAMAEMGLITPEDEMALELLRPMLGTLGDFTQRLLRLKENYPLTKSDSRMFFSETKERLRAFKDRERLESLLKEYSDKEFVSSQNPALEYLNEIDSPIEPRGDDGLVETSDHIKIRMLLTDSMRSPDRRSGLPAVGFLSNEELSDAAILERMDTSIARVADALVLDESEIELYRESILRDIDLVNVRSRKDSIDKERVLIERLEDSVVSYVRVLSNKPEDIPFKDAVYMIMFKRLVAEAASRGFKHIAWTTSESQVARWNDKYEKFYKELYDNKLVAYAKRLGGRFGAKVKKRVMPQRGVVDPQARNRYTVTEGHVDVIHISDTQNTYGATVETPLFGEIDVRAADVYEVQGYVTSGGEERTLYEKPVRVNGLEAAGSASSRIQEYIDGLVEENDTLVWSMEIPEKMVDSIENQGYGLFGTKESKIVIPSGMRSTFNYPEKGSVRIPTALEDALVPQNKFTTIGTVPRINVNASDRAQQIARGEIEGEKMSPNDWIPFYLDTNKASIFNPEYSQRASEVIKIPTKTTFWELVQDVLEFKDWGGLAGLMTLMRQKFVDKYARISEIERLVIEKMRDEGKEEKEIIRRIMADQSAAAAAYRSDRGAGVLQASLNRGIPVLRNGRTTVEDLEIAVLNPNGSIGKGKGGFTQIIKPLLRNHINKNLLEFWGFYRVNLREDRFAAEDRETQLDPVEIRAFLNDFNEALGDKGHKDHQAAKIIQMVNENFDKWNGGFVDYMVSTGVLLPEMGQSWKETADYIPFFRQWQEEATEEQSTLIETVMERVRVQNPKVPRTMIGSLTGIKLPKRAKGGKKPVLDPITTILQNSLAAITSGLKNEAAGKVMADAQYVGMAERLGVVGDYDQAGVDPGYIHTIREEGVEVDYLVKDPLLHNSLEGFTEGKLPYLSMVAAPSTFLREMITRSPDFIVANLLRDTVSAWATSGSEFTPFSDTLKNMVESRETPSYEALSRAGLNMGYDFGRDMKSARDEVMKQFRKEGVVEDDRFSIQKTIMNIWDWAGDVTTKSDMATRQAVYQDVLKRLTPVYGAEVAEVEAEYQAQEIINFSRRGNSTLARYLTAAVPFLNARVQGLDVLYRAGTGRYSAYSENTLSNEAMKIFFSRMMFLSSTALIYWMFVNDEDEYRNARPEVRQDNIILPGFGGLLGTVIPNKIPKPFEVGLIAWTIPEMFAELISGNQDMRQTVQGMTRGLQTTLSINPVPQAVRPLFEAYNNKSWFTGRSIVPYFQTGLSPQLQAGMNTSALAQEMGALFNISPLKVDHILKGYTGTVGSYILFASDLAARPMLGYEAAPSLLGEPERWPMFRRFFQGEDGGGRLAEYYDFREASERITNDILDLRGKGRHEEATKLTKDNLGIIRTQSVRQGLDNTLANLRRQRNKIFFSPTMSGAEKQRALNEIKKIETKILAGIPEIRERADLPVELPFPLSILERR